MTADPFARHYLVAEIEEAFAQGLSLGFVVSKHVARLYAMAKALQAKTSWRQVDVGSALSAWVQEQSQPVQPRLIRQGMQRLLTTDNAKPLICTGIDLLFEPALSLDPLALFRQCSRSTPLVVFWPGIYEHDKLAYAVPEHAHYRAWTAADWSDARVFVLEA